MIPLHSLSSGPILAGSLLLSSLCPGMLRGQALPEDPLSPPSGMHAHGRALLEKTLFRIDAALLDLWLGEETATALMPLLSGEGPVEEVQDGVAALAMESREATARLRFLRNIGFQRFLDGIRDGLKVSRRARLVEADFARTLSDSFPVWYGPLRERGVQEGDEMIYLVRGDTLRTLFRTVEGRILVDHTDTGVQPRLSVLGGFLAPGSDFREELLATLSLVRGPDGGTRVPG